MIDQYRATHIYFHCSTSFYNVCFTAYIIHENKFKSTEKNNRNNEKFNTDLPFLSGAGKW